MERQGRDRVGGVSTFSVILVFIVMMIIGAGVIPMLSIQYLPSSTEETIAVTYSWNGSSAKVLESEVTSKLEGLINSVDGIKGILSTTGDGTGTIRVTIKDKTKRDAIRFEISSIIRRYYHKLPQGVSYPVIMGSATGGSVQDIMAYTINSSLPTNKIERYANEKIIPELSKIKGISAATLTGATPYQYVIIADYERLHGLGLKVSDIADSYNQTFARRDNLGEVGFDQRGVEVMVPLVLESFAGVDELERLPIANVGGRIIYLKDVATVRYEQKPVSQYYRINGLNTVNLKITPDEGVNVVDVCEKVRFVMTNLSIDFPKEFSAILIFDMSESIDKELNKVIRRTIICILILLSFVFIVSRSFRYLWIIVFTLVANLLIAFVFYKLFDVDIHIYSLAGITVSLGIMIDTSIIMMSHYSYFKNRSVFSAILGALLTTIGALSIIFFLPQRIGDRLYDFAGVIIINLAISLIIALYLIPALLERYPLYRGLTGINFRKLRRVIKFNRIYERYILFGRRYRWIYIVVLVLVFGIPVHLLPDRIGGDKESKGVFAELYNGTIGSEYYRQNLKKPLEVALGGSWRLFSGTMSRNVSRGYYGQKRINIYASLPDGCTVDQLNDVVGYMERFLAGFNQIKMFKTTVSSGRASIEVTFKPEWEDSPFPLDLKSEIINNAMDFGGATWSVSGIDQNGFNNNVSMGWKNSRIVLSGYNYDRLFDYASLLLDSLKRYQRVKDPGFQSLSMGSTSNTEYYIDYNRESMVMYGIAPAEAFSSLGDRLYSSSMRPFLKDEESYDVLLRSSQTDNFDVWHLKNEAINISGRDMRFSTFGDIAKRSSGSIIRKKDQEYQLTVNFDFIGTQKLAQNFRKRMVDMMNSEVLPLGFKAIDDDGFGYFFMESGDYYVIFVVILIIFFILAILFESLIQPFAVILMIPVSIIGLFLTFYFFNLPFDHGGFAAMIMLCGIVVNAGIYIINQYNSYVVRVRQRCSANEKSVPNVIIFVRAYNQKIIPIMLTIFSTMLGLIPFFIDGKDDTFWFNFASGAVGGLLFSIIALILFLPVWLRNLYICGNGRN